MSHQSFRGLMERASDKNGSNIVIALDITGRRQELYAKSLEILNQSAQSLCGVKINHHLVLSLGLHDGVDKIVARAHDLGLPVIMDCKINDIGHTNYVIAEEYFNAGFDAVTTNPFVGWVEGLQPVFELARKLSRGVLVLVYMSHKAAGEGFGQWVLEGERTKNLQYLVFARKSLEWGADGAVVGATYPEKIEEVRGVLGSRVPIYSPGIGAQGGDLQRAVRAGATYLIVGRSITASQDPGKAACEIRDQAIRFSSVR
jgi:orotidine-5'-phosphate decarboxylase